MAWFGKKKDEIEGSPEDALVKRAKIMAKLAKEIDAEEDTDEARTKLRRLKKLRRRVAGDAGRVYRHEQLVAARKKKHG